MRASIAVFLNVGLIVGWFSAIPALGLAFAGMAEAPPAEAVAAYSEAQVHAEAGRVEEAFAAARRAVALAPFEVEYLRGLARLASWNGAYETAHESWGRVLSLLGEDQEARLGLARTAAWGGDTNTAARLYRSYVERYPEDPAARLEYARTVTWQGNAAAALEVLEGYRRDFGATQAYDEERAKVLLEGARPTEALDLLQVLVKEQPKSFRRQRLMALALAQGGQPKRAREKLATVRRLGPHDPATEETVRMVETPLRSSVTPSQNFFSDSDSVERWQSALAGELALAPSSRLCVGLAMEELQADADSGLDSLDGREVEAREGWLALRQRFSPRWEGEGRLGGAEVKEGEDLLTYDLVLQGRPTDELFLGLERRRHFYSVSPRALDLGIHRTANLLSLRWNAGLRTNLDLSGGYDEFSDGNRRWEATFAPRRQVLRRQRFNL
ncbi:MAG: tetratricopeptide repeat protein, partial [Acidobacteria bacterium]|nr:tetratricopeptide repeat protein [Acidobacteriota bacterium]